MKIMKLFLRNFIGEWASVLLTIRIHPNQTKIQWMHGETRTVSNSDPIGMFVNHI